MSRTVENRKGHSRSENVQIFTGKDCQIIARADVKRH